MKTKQILFTEPNVAQLAETELPDAPKGSQVLVRTLYSAISSGTERANLVGNPHINGALKTEEVTFPRALGYSSTGIVEAIGEHVKGLAVGDRVVVYGSKHRNYNLISANNVYKIDDDTISAAEAALVVIAGFSLGGVRKTQIEVGEAAMVVGLGILGLFAVELYRAAGAHPVIASDLAPERRQLAKEIGADYALDPADPGYVDTIKEITKGKGVNAAIEVTGVSAALLQTLDCMGKFGRIGLLGCTRTSDCNVDFYHQVHYPGVSLIGAHNCARPSLESRPGNWTHRDDCLALLDLISGKRLDFAPLVSEIHPPKDAPKVYDRLVADYKNFPIGVLFDWSQE